MVWSLMAGIVALFGGLMVIARRRIVFRGGIAFTEAAAVIFGVFAVIAGFLFLLHVLILLGLDVSDNLRLWSPHLGMLTVLVGFACMIVARILQGAISLGEAIRAHREHQKNGRDVHS